MPDHEFIGTFRMLGRSLLPIAQFLDVVSVGRSTATDTALVRRASLEGKLPLLRGHERRANPEVILLLGQHVPDQRGEFACNRDSGDLVAPLAADAQEEGSQRSWRFRCCPGSLDEHGAGMGAPMFADPTILRQTKTGLAHSRVEPKIAHQLLRLAESPDTPTAAMMPVATIALTPVIV